MFKHKHTKELYTRQAAMVAKIVRYRKDGLFVTDMAGVREVLKLAFRAARQPNLAQVLCIKFFDNLKNTANRIRMVLS